MLKQGLITEEMGSELFSNIQQIYKINKGFLEHLEKRFSVWCSDTPLADLLIQHAPFFKIYASYASNQESAINLAIKIKEKKNVKQFLEVSLFHLFFLSLLLI